MTNCDKTASQDELNTAVTRATFYTVAPSERLNIYAKLSPAQKLELWKSKLSQSAAQAVNEFQREAILNLNSKLSKDLFNQNDINIFKNGPLMEWLDRYGDYFTDMEGILIFGNLVDFNPASTANLNSTLTYRDLLMADKDSVSVRYVKAPDCTCRHGAYCSSIGDCDKGAGGCKETSVVGCGWLWLQKCNGLCGEEISPN